MNSSEFREIRSRLLVSQAALASDLGVATNTVARWERGERPIPEPAQRVIRRILGKRLAAVASAAGVDATKLEEWSRRRVAESRLPELIRQLAHATLRSPSRVDFRAGDGVQLGGWDGIIEADSGNFIVPAGRSAWELTTNSRIKPKADEDYRKRKRDPGVVPSDTTFVFATSRRWSKKDEWADARRAEAFWRDVRAYDADDIEQWLQLAPGVRVWAARMLGVLPPMGVTVLENYWEEWAAGTGLPTAAVLAGRRDASEWLVDQLGEEPAIVSVESDSPVEVVSFAAAALLAVDGDTGANLRARTLVVSDTEAWRSLVATQERLILIPVGGVDQTVVPAASAQGHHAIVPATGNVPPPSMRLPPLDREELVRELVGAGMEEERASQVASDCGRRANVLRRLLSPGPSLLAPPWASGDLGRDLAPLLLAGAWDETAEADREALQSLTNRTFDQVTELILRCAAAPEPPLARHGTVWAWISRIDSWTLLRNVLGRRDLERFERLAIDVLQDPDPRFDLPADERWTSGIHGHTPRYSRALRRGVAETVALLGARSEGAGMIADATSGEVRANRIVTAVLENQDWKRWASVSDVLTDLAEAAPARFFQALDALPDEGVRMFLGQDEGMFGGAPHPSVLWSLECLAWAPAHLTRATRALGRLAKLDPGGRLSNRPRRCLRQILTGWHPQTAASLDARLQALDALLDAEPAAGWELLLDLVPRQRESATSSHKPRWHDWLAGWSEGVTRGEYWEWAQEIYRRVLCHVLVDDERLSGLVERIADLPEPFLTQAIDVIEDRAAEMKSTSNRAVAREKLRDLLHHHRPFPDEEWSLPTSVLGRLSSVYERLQPDDIVEKHAWLFTSWPHLPDYRGESHGDEEAEHDRARMAAIAEVVDRGGVEQVISMATAVDQPHLLGWSLAALGRPDLEPDVLGKTLGSKDERHRAVGIGFVSRSARRRGVDWTTTYLGKTASSTLSSAQLADFACALPFGPGTWELVENCDAKVEETYWKRTGVAGPLGLDSSALTGILDHLLSAHRPYAAIDVAARAVRKAKGEFIGDPIQLAHVLDLASSADPENEPPMYLGSLSHEIQQLFLALERSNLDRDRMARLEWAYLPALQLGSYSAHAIYQGLATSPPLFAEIIELVYRADGDDCSEDVAADDMSRATRGWELLESWQLVPGTQEGGEIDEERLRTWVDEARQLASELNRLKVADSTIGRVFAHSQDDSTDGQWPAKEVRRMIEAIGTPELRRGFRVGVINNRGVFSKSYAEGGRQERDLAKRFRSWASALATRWPLTSETLAEIADSYELDARREDEEADARLSR